MAQISEGGEDSKGIFFQALGPQCSRNDLFCMLGLLIQFSSIALFFRTDLNIYIKFRIWFLTIEAASRSLLALARPSRPLKDSSSAFTSLTLVLLLSLRLL